MLICLELALDRRLLLAVARMVNLTLTIFISHCIADTQLLQEKISSDGLVVVNVPSDGNCMFSAIKSQLQVQSIIPNSHSDITAADVRQQIVEFMRWIRGCPDNVRNDALFLYLITYTYCILYN